MSALQTLASKDWGVHVQMPLMDRPLTPVPLRCLSPRTHSCCSDEALTTIYAKERTNAAILDSLRAGDFTCGPVGIRMCVGRTAMGGICSFSEAELNGRYTRHNPAPTSARLVLSVGDFHRSVYDTTHQYRVDLIDDAGPVFSRPITCTEPAFFALNVNKNRKFYRAEVWDETKNLRIAIGNPIWNSDHCE